MHDPLQAGNVIRIAHRFRQFEHPDEHRRNELAVRDAVALNALERVFRVELLHDDRGAAQDCTAIDQNDGAVWYSGAGLRYTDSPVIPTAFISGIRMLGASRRWQMRELAANPLGPAGGSRRVLQQITFALVGDRLSRLVGNTFRVALPTVQIVVGDQQQFGKAVGQMLGEAFADAARRPRSDQPPWRRTVVDDVGRLGGRQVGVDQRVVQAAAPRRPHHRMDVFIVLQDRRDGVALTKSGVHDKKCASRLARSSNSAKSITVLRRIRMTAGLPECDMIADLHGFTL